MTLRLLLTLFLTWTLVGLAGAQDVKKADVSGVVVDEQSEPLGSATLMLLNATDSVLVGFTTTEVDGRFKMNNVKSKW